MTGTSIAGVDMTPFGEHEVSLPELFAAAAKGAISDAGVSPEEIDQLYLGNTFGGEISQQSHLGPFVASYLGIPGIPVTRVEDACASSSNAFRQAVQSIMAGRADIVLVGGVEKTSPATGLTTSQRTAAFGQAADVDFEQPTGLTFAGAFAMVANRAIHEGLFTEEQMAAVAVKNHYNGSLNPHSHFRNEIEVDDVLESPVVADPLKLYDCCPFTDGASAVVLARDEHATRLSDAPIRVLSSEQATGQTPLHDKPDMAVLDTVAQAGQRAFAAADIAPTDVDVAEVHDCFTPAELLILEALGLMAKGTAGTATVEGQTQLDGTIPVNPSGGLKAKGHPVGATGTAQIVEVANQLWNRCDNRQVDDPMIGITQNLGGDFGSSVVTVFEAP